MNRIVSLAAAAATALATTAIANPPGAMPAPSSRLSMETDVKPAPQAGRFIVTSTMTDLETGKVVSSPKMIVESNKPATISIGAADKWTLLMVVRADGEGKKATYDATYTLDGQVISRQRVTMALDPASANGD